MRRLALVLVDLRRRRVYRVAGVYAAVAWVLWQGAEIAVPALRLPDWWLTAVVVVTLVGFPIALISAWAFDITPDGVQRAAPVAAGAGPARYRWPIAASLSAVFLLALGALFWWLRPSILGPVRPDAQVIAILPFNTSGTGSELLGEGLVDLLAANLDGVGGVRAVDSRTVLQRWRRREARGGVDLEGALALGREVDAGAVLLGGVVSHGAQVRLTAALYSVRGSELARARVDGHPDSLLSLVDGLSLELLREIWLARAPIPNLRVSAITTGSLEALRAYLEGQQYYRRSQWDRAIAAFQRAVEADSSFALAHYRLSFAYGWTEIHGNPESRRHGEMAVSFADRLPARERTLVLANQLFEDGKLAANDTMESYVERYPDDPEGWFLLGDVRFHAQPLLALELSGLYSPFDRVLEIDSTLAPAAIHPLDLSLLFDDSARFFRYLDVLKASADSTYFGRYSRARHLWTDPDSLPTDVAVLAMSDDQGEIALAAMIGMASYRSQTLTPEMYLAAVDTILEWIDEPNDRAEALMWRALNLFSMGRLAEARSAFDTLRATYPGEGYTTISLIPVYAGYADSSFAGPVLEALAGPPPAPVLEDMFDFFRMLFALSRGRASEARRLADEALADTSPPETWVVPGLFRAGQGWADLLDGDTVSGLTRLESGLSEAGLLRMPYVWPLSFVLAAAQASRPETRAEGTRRLRYGVFSDIPFIPLSYLALGQALEESGDPVGAAQAYSRFIRLWEKADPALQPRVEFARRALERLTAEPT